MRNNYLKTAGILELFLACFCAVYAAALNTNSFALDGEYPYFLFIFMIAAILFLIGSILCLRASDDYFLQEPETPVGYNMFLSFLCLGIVFLVVFGPKEMVPLWGYWEIAPFILVGILVDLLTDWHDAVFYMKQSLGVEEEIEPYNEMVECPECGEEIRNKALVCPHCGNTDYDLRLITEEGEILAETVWDSRGNIISRYRKEGF